MEIVHWYSVLVQKKVFVESSESKLNALETASRKATFKDACLEAIQSQREAEDFDALGLETVVKKPCCEDWLLTKIDDLFKQVVEAASKEKRDEDQKARKKIQESEVFAKLAALGPANVIAKFVGKCVAKENAEDAMSATDDADESEKMELVSLFKSSELPKNGDGGSGHPRDKVSKPGKKVERPVLGVQHRTHPKTPWKGGKWTASAQTKGGKQRSAGGWWNGANAGGW